MPAPLLEWNRYLALGDAKGRLSAELPVPPPEDVAFAGETLARDGASFVENALSTLARGATARPQAPRLALAWAACEGDDSARHAALDALPAACPRSEDLFAFVTYYHARRGWGRGLRRAVERWYQREADVAREVARCPGDGHWTHRDLLRLAHPTPQSPAQEALFRYITTGEVSGRLPLLEQLEDLRRADRAVTAATLIAQAAAPFDLVPSALRRAPEVLEAALEIADWTEVPALVRHLPPDGLDHPGLRRIAAERLAALPPAEWLAARPVAMTLDAFETAFPQGKRRPLGVRAMLACEVSEAMTAPFTKTSITGREVAAGVTLAWLASEPEVWPVALDGERVRELPLTSRMRLADAGHFLEEGTSGSEPVSVAQAIDYARRMRMEVDLFLVIVHAPPDLRGLGEALTDYRRERGIPARFAVWTLGGALPAEEPGAHGVFLAGYSPSARQAFERFAAWPVAE